MHANQIEAIVDMDTHRCRSVITVPPRVLPTVEVRGEAVK
jgi:hypothetical protein